jgi:hypothetical protein
LNGFHQNRKTLSLLGKFSFGSRRLRYKKVWGQCINQLQHPDWKRAVGLPKCGLSFRGLSCRFFGIGHHSPLHH